MTYRNGTRPLSTGNRSDTPKSAAISTAPKQVRRPRSAREMDDYQTIAPHSNTTSVKKHMKFNRFSDITIKTKIIGLSMFIVVLCLGGLLTFYLPYVEQNIIKEKTKGLSNLTDVVISLLTEYNDRYKKGEFGLSEAQEYAKARIKNLRYMQTEYFWINDNQLPFPTMIMHPTVSALDGKVMDNAKYNCATSMKAGLNGTIVKTDGRKNLFQAFAEITRSKGEGYATYNWPKPLPSGGVSAETYAKLSFVKEFKPWAWIVGTGLYIDDVAEEISNIRITILISATIFSALILMLSLFVAKVITKPLQIAINITTRLSQGDLVTNIATGSKDEVGQLLSSMTVMARNLRTMIAAIKSASDTVASGSNQLSVSAEQMSKGVVEQSGKAIQIATSTEEMSQTVLDIAQNASQMAVAAEDSTKIAKHGGGIVTKSVEEIESIANTVNVSAQMVKSLGKRSQQIGDIVHVIKDIANQTNLLALNAAIEAARAGEHGRGFSVVADEVRTLANRTTKATSEINEMIQAIQQEVSKAVISMDESAKKVESGVAYSKNAGTALDEIVLSIEKLTGIIHSIASATEEMSIVSGTISSDIDTIASVSKESSEGSTQIAQAAANLAHLSSDMKEVVGQFRIS
ncbi:methyl-accepting chemotaxis protein [Gammaproteobacteria bacterium]